MLDDALFLARYNPRTYNCMHHASRVWGALTGRDLLGMTPAAQLSCGVVRCIGVLRLCDAGTIPSVVVMQHAPGSGLEPHAGVQIAPGEVMHITHAGVVVEPLASIMRRYKRVRFYANPKTIQNSPGHHTARDS